ncbi:MAG: RNA-protein complex protein Nop10 [Halolamina sp.]
MRSDIHVCAAWRAEHDAPVYTLSDVCPDCGADAVTASPARFNPEDPYGEYRRRARRSASEPSSEQESE